MKESEWRNVTPRRVSETERARTPRNSVSSAVCLEGVAAAVFHYSLSDSAHAQTLTPREKIPKELRSTKEPVTFWRLVLVVVSADW